MNIGKSKSAGMGARRDFGLAGGNGKGSRSRTNQASPAWQENYDSIFRKPAKRRPA
jgi:hypothetical protein